MFSFQFFKSKTRTTKKRRNRKKRKSTLTLTALKKIRVLLESIPRVVTITVALHGLPGICGQHFTLTSEYPRVVLFSPIDLRELHVVKIIIYVDGHKMYTDVTYNNRRLNGGHRQCYGGGNFYTQVKLSSDGQKRPTFSF